MDITFEDKKILYKVRNTIIEMLNDRGYEYYNDLDFNDFSLLVESDNININVNDEVYVHFYNEHKKFGKKEFQNIVSKLQSDYGNDLNILIILKEPENSLLKNEMMKPEYKNVEIFLQKRLTFNITKHSLVPKHVLLSEEEIKDIESKYNTARNMFPKMFASDPIAKYYAAKPGNMFKILRKSHSVGTTPGYRIVK